MTNLLVLLKYTANTYNACKTGFRNSYHASAALNGAASGYMSGAITGFILGGITSNVCFAAGTAILAANGLTAIEDIKTGDYVWAWDEETGEIGLRKVKETYVNKTEELVHIQVNHEEIVTTPNHPFWHPHKGWTAAIDLRAGDMLALVNGEYVIVERVQHEILEIPLEVYNFQVEEDHTYYVSDSSVLVHNDCEIKHIYKSKKDSPNYQPDFEEILGQSSTEKVNNKQLLNELRKYGKGWVKKYQDGYLYGKQASMHYFTDNAGKIFNLKYKAGWSAFK